jgi:hypothetical protein
VGAAVDVQRFMDITSRFVLPASLGLDGPFMDLFVNEKE